MVLENSYFLSGTARKGISVLDHSRQFPLPLCGGVENEFLIATEWAQARSRIRLFPAFLFWSGVDQSYFIYGMTGRGSNPRVPLGI